VARRPQVRAAFDGLMKWKGGSMAVWKAGIGVVFGGALLLASSAGAVDGEKRQAGFYLVAAEAPNATALPAPTNEQQVVRYDQKFLRDPEPAQARYLLLPKKADVILMLAKAPALEAKGANGFPELRLELTAEAAGSLEKLSREHLGQTVAFVIDGEPVTIHKIRSVITGGQFRLSRCTDNACQYIFGRLAAKP
jgi:preprotein translocase subunit SecD